MPRPGSCKASPPLRQYHRFDACDPVLRSVESTLVVYGDQVPAEGLTRTGPPGSPSPRVALTPHGKLSGLSGALVEADHENRAGFA